MSKRWVSFNINENVKIKLTSNSLRILERDHVELYENLPNAPEFTVPKIDQNGYAEFQFWVLMERFGKHTHIGSEPPFGPNILLPQQLVGASGLDLEDK